MTDTYEGIPWDEVTEERKALLSDIIDIINELDELGTSSSPVTTGRVSLLLRTTSDEYNQFTREERIRTIITALNYARTEGNDNLENLIEAFENEELEPTHLEKAIFLSEFIRYAVFEILKKEEHRIIASILLTTVIAQSSELSSIGSDTLLWRIYIALLMIKYILEDEKN